MSLSETPPGSSTAAPEIEELARRLLALELALDNSSAGRADVALQVIEELRVRLIKLAGIHGFRSLLSRALTLTKNQVPSLTSIQVRADGTLEGFDAMDKGPKAGASEQAGILLVTHLLGLLVTFIGGPLTLQLLRDKWPEASLEGPVLRTEDNP